jgi:hypothetical protein
MIPVKDTFQNSDTARLPINHVSTPPTPPYTGQFVDPFETLGTGSSSISVPQAPPSPPRHWTMDPRLDGKEFYVRWKPCQGLGMAKVAAKPEYRHSRITLTDRAEVWVVKPEEVDHLDLPIKPTTNKAPLLVIQGVHIGKHLRQIFYTYPDGEDEPLITAAVYSDWGTSAERRCEDYIEVKATDCAFTTTDPNKHLFKKEIEELRKNARKSPKGAKTPRRPQKPRPRS